MEKRIEVPAGMVDAAVEAACRSTGASTIQASPRVKAEIEESFKVAVEAALLWLSENPQAPEHERNPMSDRHFEHEVLRRLDKIEALLRKPLPTSTSFSEITMLSTIGGNTQVFTGTFVPAGSVPPPDAVYAVTSNDPAISPTVDPTGLIVTGILPAGWVESTTSPLAYTRTASSVSTPAWTLSDIITPSAPPVGLPTSTTFLQTT